jgi:hypothetical protein
VRLRDEAHRAARPDQPTELRLRATRDQDDTRSELRKALDELPSELQATFPAEVDVHEHDIRVLVGNLT